MATTLPASTRHDRSPQTLSSSLPTSTSTAPLAIPTTQAPAQQQQPSSALSASLKAFRELAVSQRAGDNQQPEPHPFSSNEFKQAYHHARRTSFGQQGAGTATPGLAIEGAALPSAAHSPGQTAAATLPALSTSPSTSSDAGTSAGSLPTPPSSSPPAKASRIVNNNNNGSTNGSLKVKKPSSTLGGVCEGPEIALENGQLALTDDDLLLGSGGGSVPFAESPNSISASTSTVTGSAGSMFAGGAKWGWTSGTSSGTSSAMASPPLGSAGAAFSPMSLPGPGTAGVIGDTEALSPAATHRRRGSITFATTSAAVGSAATSTAGGPAPPIPATVGGSSVTSPLATSPPTSDPFRMMQPLGRVVSAGAALQTPNANASKSSSGAADGFGLFRRFSIGGLGARRTRTIPAQPPSPPSGFHHQHQHQHQHQSANLPAPTLLKPTHASLSPATISTTEAKAAKSPAPAAGAARGRTLAPAGVGGAGNGGGGAKPRKLSPMGERILRGGY
ncbi:hypothetical protein JCM10908_006148 [Rhodotorula pacifica]|uniref:uncharacterized protein n=1 Tax=Rhodotorula pacifica TaxID=1495444 RepID=UPI0031772BF9